MVWVSIFLFIFVAFLIVLYFLPYKTLKGKIFKKIYPNTPDITRVTYKGYGYTVEFVRKDTYWQMVSPDDWQADTIKMRNLMLKLADLDMIDRFTGKNPKDSEYSIGRNGILELEAKGKVVSLEFGSIVPENDVVYVVKSDDGDIVTVNAGIISALPKSNDDFKRMTLFEDVYTSIKNVEAVMESRGYLITKTNEGWIANGRNCFDEEVMPFLEGLMSLRASKFAPANTQLPPKHIGFITIRSSGKGIPRYFFESADFDGSYLVPLNGEILVVDKEEALRFFSFK